MTSLILNHQTNVCCSVSDTVAANRKKTSLYDIVPAQDALLRYILLILIIFIVSYSASAESEEWTGNFTTKVVQEEGAVQLKWSGKVNEDVSFFVVDASTDGTFFEEKARVRSEDRPSATYSVLDNNPQQGMIYYRLCQVNHDGHMKVLKMVAVEFYNYSDSLKLYPNPVRSDEFTIDSRLDEELPILVVHDMYGRSVLTTNLAWGQNEIAIENLRQNSSVYFVKVFNRSGDIILREKLLTK